MLLIFSLLAWPLAAFGGTSPVTAIPQAALCVLCAFAYRSRLGGSLDRLLMFLLAAIVVQIVSLPTALVDFISPRASSLRRSLTIGVDGDR